LLPVVKRIPNSIERSYWVQQLAQRLRVGEEDVSEELKKIKTPEYNLYQPVQQSVAGTFEPKPKLRKELLQERLVTLTLKFPQHVNSVDDSSKAMITDLKSRAADNEEFFNYLSLKAEVEELEEKQILPEIQLCLREIQSIEIKEKLDEISKDIKKAEKDQDFQRVEELTKSFNKLTKEIQLA